MLVTGAILLVGTAWVGWQTYQAYRHLAQASAQVTVLQGRLTNLAAEDSAATDRTLERLQAESAAARSAVEDPIYGVASSIPLLGPNLAAMREIAVTVDSLATDVLPSLIDVAHTLRPAELAPRDGTIDLTPIEEISPLLQNAQGAVGQARGRMESIDTSDVIQSVGDTVVTLSGKLDQAAEIIDPAARIARLLPPMLGAQSQRTYLVVFQNLAEPRATGGMFGSFAVVQANHGKITVVDQGTARSLLNFDPPVVELPENERLIYSDLMARYPADVNFTPDFPTAARLFLEMYRLRTGGTVDGLVAVDPVALSYLLKGVEPIDVGDGVAITADNAVDVLLSNAYAVFDEADQSRRDAFLANATALAFAEVMSGNGDAGVILDGLRRAGGERRVLIYSNHADEQDEIGRTTLAGTLALDTGTPSIGVFLNDATAAKLGYYLRTETHVTSGVCRADGSREMDVRVLMHYDPPADLPEYVTGASEFGKAHGLRTNVLVFSPLGGGLNGATRDGVVVGVGVGEDHSRAVGTVTVEMAAGDSTELVFTVLVPAGSGGAGAVITPELVLTPGVGQGVSSVEPSELCLATPG